VTGVPSSIAPGQRRRIDITVAGLTGSGHDAEIRIEVLTPALAFLNLAGHSWRGGEHMFIRPTEARPDGTFVIRRTLTGIRRGGPVVVAASPVVPTTPREQTEQVIRRLRAGVIPTRRTYDEALAELLRPLGERALPRLAELLTDPELALQAADVLLRDQARGVPLVIAALSDIDASARGTVLSGLSSQLAKDPAFPYRAELRDAVRRLLDAGKRSQIGILTLGILGSSTDLPVLETVHRDESSRMLRDAAEQALARLGSRPHIEHIMTRLGVAVKTSRDAIEFGAAASAAAYAGHREFVPHLCAHLTDGTFTAGEWLLQPARAAAGAIASITGRTPTPETLAEACRVPTRQSIGSTEAGRPIRAN
jgi:hypothetical protein